MSLEITEEMVPYIWLYHSLKVYNVDFNYSDPSDSLDETLE